MSDLQVKEGEEEGMQEEEGSDFPRLRPMEDGKKGGRMGKRTVF